MGELATRQETSRALAAYMMYLELPVPRSAQALAGRRPKGTNGREGKPFSAGTLKQWSYMHKWAERARIHDAQVAYEREQALTKWKVDEQERRLRQRLQAAEVQRAQAMEYLVDTTTKRPKPLSRLEPRLAEIAAMFIKHSGESERLDLGGVTARVEVDAAQPVQVIDQEGLSALREIVSKLNIQTAASRQIAEIVDAEVVMRDDSD